MQTEKISVIPLSAMSVVFADKKPKRDEICREITLMKNEAGSFQLAFSFDNDEEIPPKGSFEKRPDFTPTTFVQ